MDWIIWDNAFELGNESMDREHRLLVTLINLLADSLAHNHGKEMCTEVLDEIIGHTRTHFCVEEELMASLGRPLSDAHKVEHRYLLELATLHKRWFSTGSMEASIALLEFLESTLARHILNSDKTLADKIQPAEI